MPAIRRAVRVSAFSAASALVLMASPASADVPEGWSNPDKVDPMFALLVFGLLPIVITLLIVALGLAPKLIKGEKILDQSGSQLWIGGPNKGTAALGGAGSDESTGGASGSY